MSLFGGLFGDDDDNRKETKSNDAKLRLKKEELDIAKNRVQKGEVELGKEIVEEHKSVDVPVTHEEVVIERKCLDNEVTDSPITNGETIRIPVSEEKVDVDKHTVVTGEVSAHKRAIQETAHVDETLKREEARVHTTGEPNLVDTNIDER